MRAAVVGFLAAGIAAAPAHAAPRADYRQVFSTPVPGASTGIDTQIVYRHPEDPDAKPIPVRQEVFTFPEGTVFDGSVAPDCRASDLELRLLGQSACPAASRVGRGEGGTFMTGFPGSGETPMELAMFNTATGFVVVGNPEGMPIRNVARGRREGRVVTVDAPVMPGGPPDWESALRRVHNIFDARSRGSRAYVRTPPSCPASGVWEFRARFVFADGVEEEYTHAMPCSG